MKAQVVRLICLFTLISAVSCNTQKIIGENELFSTPWELEYITGPRIAFDGLYPDKKPKISFDKESGKVTGNSSCNGYSAPYTLENNLISFGEAGPTTMMFCGEGGQVFLKMMKKINHYTIDADGKLNLMMDDVTMMRFKKSK